jgi:hypothetical protein
MDAGWKIFLLFAAVFTVALGAERLFVADVVPVALADQPQALWSVETAFVLRAIELMSAGVAMISFVLMLLTWARQLARRGAQ